MFLHSHYTNLHSLKKASFKEYSKSYYYYLKRQYTLFIALFFNPLYIKLSGALKNKISFLTKGKVVRQLINAEDIPSQTQGFTCKKAVNLPSALTDT